MHHELIHYTEVSSTNLLLKELCRQGAPEGCVILADRQTEGRGRLGRSFFSPEGGLYFSLLLRPASLDFSATLLTTAAAVAMAESIDALFPGETPTAVKWVNDLYRSGKKVCGILAEGMTDGQTSAIILGLGVNLCPPPEGFPEELRDKAGALYPALSPDELATLRLSLCQAFLSRFDRLFEALPDTAFMERYRKRMFLTGRQVSYVKAGLRHFVTVLGVDDDGGLLIEEKGQKNKLTAGEVSLEL